MPEDRAAIQLSIGEVLQRIAANQLDPRRAGLLLYGLQIASGNLPPQSANSPADSAARELVEEIEVDSELGTLAPQADIADPPRHRNEIRELLDKIERKAALRRQAEALELARKLQEQAHNLCPNCSAKADPATEADAATATAATPAPEPQQPAAILPELQATAAPNRRHRRRILRRAARSTAASRFHRTNSRLPVVLRS
jgi:hypothetical protein